MRWSPHPHAGLLCLLAQPYRARSELGQEGQRLIVTSLLLASVVRPVKWTQRFLVKQSPNERPSVAVELCHYRHHSPLLLLIWLGRRVKGKTWGKNKNKEVSLAVQHPELARSHTAWPGPVTPSLSRYHTQPKTSYHLTSPWELGPKSSNVKPAGPVCWDEITPLDLLYGCLPTTLHLPPCPAQQGDLGKSPKLSELWGSWMDMGRGATGRSQRWGLMGEHTDIQRGEQAMSPRFS